MKSARTSINMIGTTSTHRLRQISQRHIRSTSRNYAPDLVTLRPGSATEPQSEPLERLFLLGSLHPDQHQTVGSCLFGSEVWRSPSCPELNVQLYPLLLMRPDSLKSVRAIRWLLAIRRIVQPSAPLRCIRLCRVRERFSFPTSLGLRLSLLIFGST